MPIVVRGPMDDGNRSALQWLGLIASMDANEGQAMSDIASGIMERIREKKRSAEQTRMEEFMERTKGRADVVAQENRRHEVAGRTNQGVGPTTDRRVRAGLQRMGGPVRSGLSNDTPMSRTPFATSAGTGLSARQPGIRMMSQEKKPKPKEPAKGQTGGGGLGQIIGKIVGRKI